MRRFVFCFTLFIVFQSGAQVVDVNGDQTVGPHEAIALSERWKGPAAAANDHDHLGQTWEGDDNPLIIRGSFPGNTVKGTPDKGDVRIIRPAAPLRLDNTATDKPDLVLGGVQGTIEAVDLTNSSMVIRTNSDLQIFLSADEVDPTGALVINGPQGVVASFLASKSATLQGDLSVNGNITADNINKIVRSTSKASQDEILQTFISSPEELSVYSGNVVLDEAGEATVFLSDRFETVYRQYRYQLTPIGFAAPGLYVAGEISDNQFRIAGGRPGLKVSWQVTGVGQDEYEKAEPMGAE